MWTSPVMVSSIWTVWTPLRAARTRRTEQLPQTNSDNQIIPNHKTCTFLNLILILAHIRVESGLALFFFLRYNFSRRDANFQTDADKPVI